MRWISAILIYGLLIIACALALYFLKLKAGRPMTHLVREAVDQYLHQYGGSENLIPKEKQEPAIRRDW